jgi:hypothetical protein
MLGCAKVYGLRVNILGFTKYNIPVGRTNHENKPTTETLRPLLLVP